MDKKKVIAGRVITLVSLSWGYDGIVKMLAREAGVLRTWIDDETKAVARYRGHGQAITRINSYC